MNMFSPVKIYTRKHIIIETELSSTSSQWNLNLNRYRNVCKCGCLSALARAINCSYLKMYNLYLLYAQNVSWQRIITFNYVSFNRQIDLNMYFNNKITQVQVHKICIINIKQLIDFSNFVFKIVPFFVFLRPPHVKRTLSYSMCARAPTTRCLLKTWYGNIVSHKKHYVSWYLMIKHNVMPRGLPFFLWFIYVYYWHLLFIYSYIVHMKANCTKSRKSKYK